MLNRINYTWLNIIGATTKGLKQYSNLVRCCYSEIENNICVNDKFNQNGESSAVTLEGQNDIRDSSLNLATHFVKSHGAPNCYLLRKD